MKHNRIVFIIATLLALTLAFTGCGSSGSSEAQQPVASTQVMGMVSKIYMSKDGGDNVEMSDKATLKEIRATMNRLKAVDDAKVPEDEELYVYLEWDDGGANSKYAFVYHMADGTSLVELSESNSDEEPTYYTDGTAYNDLAAIIDKVQQ